MNFHISFAVRVLDDYTGKCIENSLAVFIEGGKPPIMKNNGYYVFVDVRPKEVMLHISHPQYIEEIQLIEFSESSKIPEIIVRLIPNHLYDNLHKITAIRGFVEPGQKVSMRCLTPSRPFKLWKDYEWDDCNHIFLYNPRSMELAGKRFLIENKKENKKEVIRVLGQDYTSKWKVIIEVPLSSSYSKPETCLYPIYETYGDENGCFLFCLWEEIKKEGRCLISVSGDSWTMMEFSIEANKINDISFS